MKKAIIVLVIIFVSVCVSFAQQRGPSNPGGEPQGGDPPLGGGAPIGGGTGILIAMGAIYLSRKIYNLKTADMEELES